MERLYIFHRLAFTCTFFLCLFHQHGIFGIVIVVVRHLIIAAGQVRLVGFRVSLRIFFFFLSLFFIHDTIVKLIIVEVVVQVLSICRHARLAYGSLLTHLHLLRNVVSVAVTRQHLVVPSIRLHHRLLQAEGALLDSDIIVFKHHIGSIVVIKLFILV